MSRNGSSAQAIQRRAVRLVETPGQIIQLRAKIWMVASTSTKGKFYRVEATESGLKCECTYHEKRQAMCKHAKAVELLLLRESKELLARRPETVTLKEIETPCCPECKSTYLKKDGMRKHKKRGPSQKFKCRKCGKHVSGPVGYTGRHYAMDAINHAILLASMGLSFSNVAIALKEGLHTSVHRDTIRRWFDFNTELVEGYVRTPDVSVSGKWSTDEKSVRIGRTTHWIYTVMDTGSRFILSYDIAKKKLGYNARSLFQAAADRAGGVPRMLVSDRLHGFGVAFRKVFRRNKNPQPIHFAEAHIRNERCTNNMHERLNGTISDELRYTRGMKSENSTLIRAYLIHYNFVRPHMALCGRTPADAAGIEILGTRWQVLIQNAAMAASMAA